MRALMLAALLGLVPTPAFALTIGVVKMEAAMQATKHWQQAKTRLEKEKSKRQAVLDEKQAELQKKREEIEAQRAVATPEALRPREQELMARAQELGQQFQALQQELAQLEQRYTQQLLVRFQSIVRQVAIDNDLDYVFAEGNEADPNVLFAKPTLDLTDEVVERYRKNYGDQPLELD